MSPNLSQAAEIRLGRQRAPEYESGEHLVPYLRSANVMDGSLDLTDVKEMNFTPAEQTIFALQDGDVLMTEGSGSRDTVGTSAVWRGEISGSVCFQNTLLRLRPRDGVTDGRFLAWWARHAWASGQIAAVSSGANIQHIGSDGLKRLQVQIPQLSEQRRIADFLDDRVARIDQIITARRSQSAHLAELQTQQMRLAVAGVSGEEGGTRKSCIPWLPAISIHGREVPLGRVVTLQRGVDLTEDERMPGDVPVVTTAGIVGTHDRAIAQGPGVVIGRYGSVGNVHWLDQPYWPHNTTLYAKATHGNLMRWIYFLLTIFPYDAMQARAAVPGVNRNDMATELIPWIPLPAQQRACVDLDTWLDTHARRKQDLEKLVVKLSEYKQSLITAAVTGEFDVTTATMRVPGE